MPRALSAPIDVPRTDIEQPLSASALPGRRRACRRAGGTAPLVPTLPVDTLGERFRAGDVAALDAVFLDLHEPLVAYAYSVVRDYDDAEEAVQCAVIRAWNARDRLPATASLRACLYQLTRRMAADRLRPARRRARLLDRVAGFFAAAEPQRPDDVVHRRLLFERIDRAVHAFPPAEREAFWLRRVLGLSYAEIAHVQGVPAETARSRVKSGHKRLRAQVVDPSV
jgi:RNA polymerase sigma-70 factor (ECF subfamily)